VEIFKQLKSILIPFFTRYRYFFLIIVKNIGEVNERFCPKSIDLLPRGCLALTDFPSGVI